MSWLKRILIAGIALLLAAITLAFILENREMTHLQFMTLQTPELPVAFFVTLAFIVGAAVGLSFGLLLHARLFLRSRSELRRSQAENERLRRQLPASNG